MCCCQLVLSGKGTEDAGMVTALNKVVRMASDKATFEKDLKQLSELCAYLREKNSRHVQRP